MDELRVWIRLPVLIFRFYFAPSRLCVNSSEMVSRKVDRNLRRAYKLMRARFGHQHWWPGETPFEVCVGAILTQNTAWANVEHALANLKAACVLEPARLFALPESRLAGLIRPAGYFNVKARRLRSFLRVLVEDFGGDLKRLFDGELSTVRARLLAIHGVGPETADSLLLYAGGHHSFVIDAYTRRIFQRHEWSHAEGRRQKAEGRNPKSIDSYDELKSLCESALNQKAGAARLDYWQDYHAQLVMVGKHFCRPRAPLCQQCPLKPLLPKNR
jgi:endonuclease-3 related protein